MLIRSPGQFCFKGGSGLARNYIVVRLQHAARTLKRYCWLGPWLSGALRLGGSPLLTVCARVYVYIAYTYIYTHTHIHLRSYTLL